MHKSFVYILSAVTGCLLTGVLPPPVALSRPAADRPDLREACRQAVAGEYISAYDSVRAGRTSLVQVDEMKERVAKALKDAEQELTALRRKVERVSYDVALSDQLIQQGEKVKALDSTLAIYTEQAGTVRAKLVIVENREAVLRKSIETVFTIVRGRQNDKNYPIEIRYKADCPKFRFMCALPLRYHHPLTAISLRPDSEEICARYVNYSMSGVR